MCLYFKQPKSCYGWLVARHLLPFWDVHLRERDGRVPARFLSPLLLLV